jgi:C-terminal binding protein
LHHDSQRTLISATSTALPKDPPKVAPWSYISTPLLQRPSASRTFGILGLGRIGTAVALRIKPLSYSRIIFYDPYLPAGVDRALGLTRVHTIEELFSQSNTLSIHCPLTAQTRRMVSKRLINLMPEGSVLINTARGAVVDLDAVHEGLKTGVLAGAGLDVLPVEPAPEGEDIHPMVKAYREGEEWLKGRLVITPHTAYYSPESWVDIRTLSCETMRDVLLDGGMRNVIPPEAD